MLKLLYFIDETLSSFGDIRRKLMLNYITLRRTFNIHNHQRMIEIDLKKYIYLKIILKR